jgi:hypothetical protein
MRLRDNNVCRKCGHDEDSSKRVLCQCSDVARVTIKIFGPALLGPMDIFRALVKQFLASTLITGLL